MEDKNNFNKKHRKKAFTLIELLAVIIILGVLMIIAVPSVTKYIDDSRKSGYVSTAKELAGGARSLIHSGSLNLTDKDTTYYIDSKCIESSNGAKTPYGELTKAYVVVNYTDEGYDYYWISVDSTGTGVKKITNLEELDTDSIERDITETDILNNLGVDARHNYVIISEENGCSIGTVEEAPIRVDTEGNADVIDYPVGKNKRTLNVGDIVKIGDEEFFFLSYKGTDAVLISRYNLMVGIDVLFEKTDRGTHVQELKTYSPSEPGYGLQNSKCLGRHRYEYNTEYCLVAFSTSHYWNGQVGEGKKYPDNYVYDSNSSLYPYIENYKSYLEGLGANIKEARLLRDDDYIYKENVFDALFATTYWRGKIIVIDGSSVYASAFMRPRSNSTTEYDNEWLAGVRPVIII